MLETVTKNKNTPEQSIERGSRFVGTRKSRASFCEGPTFAIVREVFTLRTSPQNCSEGLLRKGDYGAMLFSAILG